MLEAGVNQAFLMPGQYKISRDPCLITTVLGSCVSVCLFHPRHNFGGMNHYMLPENKGSGLDGGKYGRYANNVLFQFFVDNLGSLKGVVGMIFGGANVLHFDNHIGATIGDQNIAQAREMLRGRNVPVIREQVGGQVGLKLKYRNWDNGIEVLPINPVAQAEVKFMQKDILEVMNLFSKYQN